MLDPPRLLLLEPSRCGLGLGNGRLDGVCCSGSFVDLPVVVAGSPVVIADTLGVLSLLLSGRLGVAGLSVGSCFFSN